MSRRTRNRPMTDLRTLRDHIADVLAHHPTFNLKDDGYSAEDVLRMADVLIRELQLTVLGDGIVVGVIHE